MATINELFYETHNPKLYTEKGYALQFQAPRLVGDKSYVTNATLAAQWGCTERHASKARRGIETIVCAKDSCGCPINQKKLAALKAAGEGTQS